MTCCSSLEIPGIRVSKFSRSPQRLCAVEGGAHWTQGGGALWLQGEQHCYVVTRTHLSICFFFPLFFGKWKAKWWQHLDLLTKHIVLPPTNYSPYRTIEGKGSEGAKNEYQLKSWSQENWGLELLTSQLPKCQGLILFLFILCWTVPSFWPPHADFCSRSCGGGRRRRTFDLPTSVLSMVTARPRLSSKESRRALYTFCESWASVTLGTARKLRRSSLP